MKIQKVITDKKQYLDLLLLADEQENMIDRYLEQGTMYVLNDNGIIAVCVVTDEDNKALEIKNIAVKPEFQRRGYGKAMLDFITKKYKDSYDIIQVGTGEVPAVITFYEKCGFQKSHKIESFFTDNYDHEIYEDGIKLIDMIYLSFTYCKDKILETERLYLREMTEADFPFLCKHLQDSDVMYAYEHPFSDSEVWEGINKQLNRYKKCGFGVWAVILKENGKLIGQCGLSMQDCGGKEVLEIGYIFQKKYWHKGYASEATVACREYAFNKLNAGEVFSIIRDTNIASQNVAKRNGMSIRGQFIKHYYSIDMPHFIFSVKKDER